MADFIKLKSDGGWEKAVAHWQSLAGPGLREQYLDAAEEAAAYVLMAVKNEAASVNDEWSNAIQGAQVARSNHGVGLAFPAETYDLEYGNPEEGITANRVIHRTINREAPAVKDRMGNLLHDRLWSRD